MKERYLVSGFLFLFCFQPIQAQPPESFFPHDVGDRWDYAYWNGGFFTFYTTVLTRDSVGYDGSTYLYYDNSAEPKFKIDTSHNVYLSPSLPNSNYVIYKLGADSGDAWFNNPEWAWVASVDSGFAFSQPTVIKKFEYGPAQPYALAKRWLASGFGFVYEEWPETGQFSTITACVIAGDTFGILVSVPPPPGELPKAFVLHQNYPNPFNPTTTIGYELPRPGFVTLKIYNILGEEIAVLVDGFQNAGNYQTPFDASGLPSSVYFYRLVTAGKIMVRKMILTK